MGGGGGGHSCTFSGRVFGLDSKLSEVSADLTASFLPSLGLLEKEGWMNEEEMDEAQRYEGVHDCHFSPSGYNVEDAQTHADTCILNTQTQDCPSTHRQNIQTDY